MKIEIPFQTKIPFLNGEEPLVYDADSIAEAVARAVKEDADLTRADLSHADLRGADLREADLSHADLSDADLSDADLSDADLSDADLSNACLKNTDLGRADLSGANLSYANLYYANLSYAYLAGANLYYASLIGAKVQDKTLWGKRPFLSLSQCGSVNRTTLAFFFEDGSEPFIMCGCFKGGLKEFKARIKETHSGTFYEVEYNAMVDYIEALYKEQQQQTKKEGRRSK